MAAPAAGYAVPAFDVGALQQHPIMQQAMAAFQADQLPQLQNQLAAQGLDSSPAALQLVQRGMAAQQNQALQQILGSSLQARGQTIGAMLQGRGQDLNQRQQNLSAMLAQGGMGLQARGQDQTGLAQGMAGMAGLNQAGLQQYLAGLGQAGVWGGRERSILDAIYGAEHAERLRQAEMAGNLINWPLGGANAMIGSRSTSGK
jgi:hypothetical protein